MMAVMAEPPHITQIDELPAIFAAGVTWRPVRRELGVRAFGVNAYTANAGDLLIEEHDETGSGSGRHEELYVVIAGAARFTIDGTEHDAPAGTLVFLPDPTARRAALALADGTAALVVGGRVGEPYSISPWENWFAAKAFADDGDPDAAADHMAVAIDEYPGNPAVLYNAACFEALAGRREAALAHLREAVELDPKMLKWAAEDVDFDAIRDDPAFPQT
jgi:tetratricopeptide (TPR) repeat protein